jgi:allantoate deiminase
MVKVGTGTRAVERCNELGVAPFSDLPGALYRAYLTPAHAAALRQTAIWMSQAGMTVRLDSAANLIGRYEAELADAPALLIASHIDSVRNAGRYDGPLGIMLGIECVARLNSEERRLPFAIEVIAFGDEEGSRFPESMLCSRAIAGVLKSGAAEVKDPAGVSVAEALRTFDVVADLKRPDEDLSASKYQPKDVIGYLEAHIEQGPVLESEGLSVGVVSGIAAQLRFNVFVSGEAGHAGTAAMHLRKDALAGAAEMLIAVEHVAREGGTELVATVGQLEVRPGSVNVVPGHVRFSLDIRSGSAAVRDAAAYRIFEAFEAIAANRGLGITKEQTQDLPASPCDTRLTSLLEVAMEQAGYPKRTLVSGAGHDAMVMSALCPTAMLFIRCERGISHNPAEAVTAIDADAALAVMTNFLNLLESRYNG